MPDNLEQDLKGFGEYLGKLLHSSTLSPEQKEAWAVLVPEMTLDQLFRFAAVLEKYVPDAFFQDLIALRNQLLTIKAEYDKKMEGLSQKAQAELAAVMDEVKAAEQAATSS